MDDYMKRKVDLLLRVDWKSDLAEHRDEYFCKVNVWRECSLFPQELQHFVENGVAGDEMTLSFSEGEIFPFDPKKIYECESWQFSPPDKLKNLVLRRGRFYPLGFFRGLPGIFPENIIPGRVVSISPSGFVIDANHPMCYYAAKVTARIVEVGQKIIELGGMCIDHWGNFLSGPGMQARYKGKPTDFGIDDPTTFSREDEREDSIFYAEPRLVGHIDRVCHQNLMRFYSQKMPKKGIVLDLMSSYESHLPEGDYEVYGLGINRAELEANPRLNHIVVKDINADPSLPFSDEFFDVVVCDLSIEYVVKPLQLLREVKRVLKKGGQFYFSFSNRYFPPKVIRGWIDLHEFERVGFVLELLSRVDGLGSFGTYSLRGYERPIDKWIRITNLSDPLYVVYGCRVA